MAPFRSIAWENETLILLDQRQLPHQTVYLQYRDPASVADAIQTMVVRGAPAIGVTAAFGMVLAATASTATQPDGLLNDLQTAAHRLMQARPTAVNLAWAVKRMLAVASESLAGSVASLRQQLIDEAQNIYQADIQINRQMGLHAQSLIPDGAKVIHHCNTGALATVDYGTALGVIRIAHEQGKQIHAFLDETRPRLQGASLSAYELKAYGIPHTVIVDGASGYVMKTQKINCCLVGCDRVSANGDVANKIGTYNLAIVAKAHRVPFYVACPLSTLDRSLSNGDEINIEERAPEEITHIQGQPITPAGTQVLNPAFDVTPHEYITAIITEKGIAYPPYPKTLAALFDT
ncbi:MAG: S-methyl-5-thioribose-1-phosphate isomerase [Cyanobacteria bacterium P01_A01_bin.114]